MTRITIENQYSVYTVSTSKEDLNSDEMGELLKAAMCVMGYHPELVAGVFK